MTTSSVCFRCQECRARIKAPVQLVGRSRSCPGCGRALKVPVVLAADAEPILVPVEGEDRFTLGVMYRSDAALPPRSNVAPRRAQPLVRARQSA